MFRPTRDNRACLTTTTLGLPLQPWPVCQREQDLEDTNQGHRLVDKGLEMGTGGIEAGTGGLRIEARGL